VVVPEEAVIVKRIFREYLEGSSILQIAKGLEADGIITVTGLEHWHPGTINNMLSMKSSAEMYVCKRRIP